MEYLDELFSYNLTPEGTAILLACLLAFAALGIIFWLLDNKEPQPVRVPSYNIPLTKTERKVLSRQRQNDLILLKLRLELDREQAAEAIREGMKCMVFDGKMSKHRANFWMAELHKVTGLPIVEPVMRKVANKIGKPKADFLKMQIKKRLNGGRMPAQLS